MRNQNQNQQQSETVQNLQKTVAELQARIVALEARPARKTGGKADTLDSVTLAFLRETPATPTELRDRIVRERPDVLRNGWDPDTLLNTTIRRLREESGVKNLGVKVQRDAEGKYYDVAAWEAEQKAAAEAGAKDSFGPVVTE